MIDNHPITPPPGLVERWIEQGVSRPSGTDYMMWFATQAARLGADQELEACVEWTYANFGHMMWFATQAARWGADQELEACVEWTYANFGHTPALNLRLFRRPKPPSLKEQALAHLDSLHADLKRHGLGTNTDTIRRALEQLDD